MSTTTVSSRVDSSDFWRLRAVAVLKNAHQRLSEAASAGINEPFALIERPASAGKVQFADKEKQV